MWNWEYECNAGVVIFHHRLHLNDDPEIFSDAEVESGSENHAFFFFLFSPRSFELSRRSDPAPSSLPCRCSSESHGQRAAHRREADYFSLSQIDDTILNFFPVTVIVELGFWLVLSGFCSELLKIPPRAAFWLPDDCQLNGTWSWIKDLDSVLDFWIWWTDRTESCDYRDDSEKLSRVFTIWLFPGRARTVLT